MRVQTPLDLGLLIRERRRQLKLRQQDLAEQVGVSRQWLIEVEAGKSSAEIGLVLRTLNVLGLRLDLGEAPPPISQDWAPDLDLILAAFRGETL